METIKKVRQMTDDGFPIMDEVYVYAETVMLTTYHVHIDEIIQEPIYFRKLQGLLSSAQEGDTVVFHLNTGGGDFYTALAIIGWIHNTEATTVAVIEGEVCSAGTFFIMACDNVIAMPHSVVMLHSASYGTYGDTKRVRKFVKFQDEQISKFTQEIYEGFLTIEEINSMVEDSEEIWLTSEEVIERLNSRSDNNQKALIAEDSFEETMEEILEKESTKNKPNEKDKIEKVVNKEKLNKKLAKDKKV